MSCGKSQRYFVLLLEHPPSVAVVFLPVPPPDDILFRLFLSPLTSPLVQILAANGYLVLCHLTTDHMVDSSGHAASFRFPHLRNPKFQRAQSYFGIRPSPVVLYV
jgi:hypothetical protein